MNNHIKAVILCALLLSSSTVWATHPLGVEDTGTKGSGRFLLELTSDYVKQDSDVASTLKGGFTVGAGEHTDFTVEMPYHKLDPSPVTGAFASGNGDTRIKMKHQLFENEVKQSMAYLLYLDLPSGNAGKGLGSNQVLWGLKLIDSQVCCSNAFHLNVGYEALGKDLKRWNFAREYALTFGFAVEHTLSDSFRVLGEVAGESRRELDMASDGFTYSRPFTLLAGMIYDVSKTCYLDLGARAGLNKYAEDTALLAGAAWRF